MLKIKRLLRFPLRNFSDAASNYQKRCFEFEENWKAMADEKNKQLTQALEEELTADQKKYISALAKAFCDLTIYELDYYHKETMRVVNEIKGVPLMTLMTDWPSVKKNADGRYPVADATWFLQQEKLAEMWPGGLQDFAKLFSNLGSGSGGGSTDSAASNNQAAVEEKKEEKPKVEEAPKEKTSFEIELASFDAAQKIKIIKEVRQIFNLGLKDAKDLVEKAPVMLKKDSKKEEAESIKEKLTAAGCTINLK